MGESKQVKQSYSLVTIEVEPPLTIKELRAAFDSRWTVVTRWGAARKGHFGAMPMPLEEKTVDVHVVVAQVKERAG